MASDTSLHLYLEEPFRKSAAAGEHNFINLIVKVATHSGMRVEFAPHPGKGEASEGYSLTHMKNPPNDRGLVFRRAYHYPFWQIDAVAQRWHWDVARATFDPDKTSDDAARFYGYWQNRLFGDAPQNASRVGPVYIPLQGHLNRQRLFQSCTPLEMIEHCLAHNPTKQVVAALHPKENYSGKDLADLKKLDRRHAGLTVATGGMEQYLKTCDYVVTQNSGVAFSGFFFGKPTLLFGQVDFHHITERADLDALNKSFARVAAMNPVYDKYIWWYWQDQSINAGRDTAEAKIAARLKRFGWPID